MAVFIPFLSWLIVLPALFVLSYLMVELIAGLAPLRRPATKHAPPRDIVFLVPAHNEEAGVGDTVRDLKGKARDCRILVVADNCSDATAMRAREAGADVVERNDTKRRGKGHALAFGRNYLASTPPDLVVILDADCRVGSQFVEEINESVSSHGKPVQASNLFSPDLTLPAKLQLSNFAMVVKNLFRMRGMYRLCGSASLLGTGMGFTWEDFARLQLATDDSTEDIKLTVDLLAEGGKVVLADRAQVWSRAESIVDTAGQRQRWEHGFLRHSLRYALPSLFRGILHLSPAQFILGMHLLVPPLALLIMLSIGTTLITGVFVLAGGPVLPPAITLGALAGLGMILGIAWLSEGRKYLSAGAIASLPKYFFWKLPIYARFLSRRKKSWGEDA